MAIDWNFLVKVETSPDQPLNEGFVPMRDGKPIQESGVTLGTGVDLGQQSEEKFKSLGIPQVTIDKLKPFFKKKRDKAVKALEDEEGLTITEDEVLAIDKALKKDTLKQVKSWYNKDNKLGQDWADLSDEQQTTVLSVFYNHGLDGAPNFKKQVASGDWTAAIENLRNFYPSKDNELHSRRVKEAQYLAGLPPEEIDGIDGDITAAAVEKFKNTVGVSTPDQVRPEQPQIGSLEYFDNMMAMVNERRKTRQGASQTPSEPRTQEEEPEQQFTEEEEALIQSSLGYTEQVEDAKPADETEFTPAEIKLLERATGMPVGEEVEAKRRAQGTIETEEPVRVKPEGGQNDTGKDPIFGIF